MAGKRQSTEHKVGECKCGQAIMLGDRYSVATEGPTTLKRACQGYRCNRVNEIVLTVQAKVIRATWNVLDCLCGTPIYLRSDYAGVNFEGWEGTAFEAMVSRERDRKNRTVKTPCRGCGCKYTIPIRFTREKDEKGEEHWYRSTNGGKVMRCRSCKARKEAQERAKQNVG